MRLAVVSSSRCEPSQNFCDVFTIYLYEWNHKRYFAELSPNILDITFVCPLHAFCDQSDDELELGFVPWAVDHDLCAEVGVLVQFAPPSTTAEGGAIRRETEVNARVIHPVQVNWLHRITPGSERGLGHQEFQTRGEQHRAGARGRDRTVPLDNQGKPERARYQSPQSAGVDCWESCRCGPSVDVSGRSPSRTSVLPRALKYVTLGNGS